MRQRRRVSASKCHCSSHVSPVANIVESANSHAKLGVTARRSYVSPEALQTTTILKLSKPLWPSEKTTQEALDKLAEEQSESEDDEDDSEGMTTKMTATTKTSKTSKRTKVDITHQVSCS